MSKDRFHRTIICVDPNPQPPILSSFIVKLAGRCNIQCTYCYWFRDPSVYDRPALLSIEVEELLIFRLRLHIQRHAPKDLSITFHGGEPLLFGKQRFATLCEKLDHLARATGCPIEKSITTNGLLLDVEWAELLARHEVGVALSLDGSQRQHDLRRIDMAGRGTHSRVMAALALLRNVGIRPGILAVCDPHGDPEELCRAMFDELGLTSFDVLIPDATCDETPPSIAPYFMRLFDLWFDRYSHHGVRIRFLENLVRGILHRASSSDDIGYGALIAVGIATDGAIEPLDVLHIVGPESTRTACNLRSHDLEDVKTDPVWREAYVASLHLAAQCQTCQFRQACGGGYLPHRWSRQRRFDNPNVYCQDLQRIFAHVRERILPSLYLVENHS